MNKPKKSEYQKLRQIWYKKLKSTGFVDIEHDDDSINNGIPRSFMHDNELLRDSVTAYYNMAHHFLTEYQFESELEKVMWEYHAEGLSIRNIVKVLNSTKAINTNRERVWKTIRRLVVLMKERYLVL